MIRLTRQQPTGPVKELEPYEEFVVGAIEKPSRSLYFPEPLERLFEQETQHARSRHLVAIGIIWIALGVFVALLVRGSSGPAPFGINPTVRIAVITPILIGIVATVWWGVRPFVREFLMMVACIVAPASLMLGAMLTPGIDIGTNRGALTIILLFITVVVRLRFWFAAVACFVLVGIQIGIPLVTHTSVPGNGILSLITIGATLTANYTLEREYRLNYLQRLLGRIRSALLESVVEQLQDLSHRDALTGLSNRRALDTLLEDLCASRARFSVILVDVDGFKAFNDTYGHQIGDDALRRIAAMLRASLRFTTDRIARMGGEEFAVVLPQTGLEDARTMAERMRNAVLDLRIPHVASPTGRIISMSAGVSTSSGTTTPAAIISAADKALYQAKLNGRNRVELASPDSPEPFLPESRATAIV